MEESSDSFFLIFPYRNLEFKMAYKLKPIIKKIMVILEKEKFYISRMSGSHIIINRNPQLKRPIVIPNDKKLSNAVRLNLLKECEEIGLNISELKNLF